MFYCTGTGTKVLGCTMSLKSHENIGRGKTFLTLFFYLCKDLDGFGSLRDQVVVYTNIHLSSRHRLS